MRVAVVGGTGTLGRQVVGELIARGDLVRVLSRGVTRLELPAEASHRPVDLAVGEGLVEALRGVDVVVDASNSRKRADEVLVEGSRRLLAAGAETGVRHHLTISIVGCDRVPMGYYRSKTSQEEAVAAGRVPWTVLRATQFHPLVAEGFAAAARWRLRPTGAARLQPIDVGVVARHLAAAAHAGPAGRLPNLAGPEVRTLDQLGRAWQGAANRRLVPVRVPSIGRLGRSLREGGLCDEGAAVPGPSFEDWLADA